MRIELELTPAKKSNDTEKLVSAANVEWSDEIEELQDISAIEKASFGSKLLFTWVRPFLKQA